MSGRGSLIGTGGGSDGGVSGISSRLAGWSGSSGSGLVGSDWGSRVFVTSPLAARRIPIARGLHGGPFTIARMKTFVVDAYLLETLMADLVRATRETATAVPEYAVQRPWRRPSTGRV